MNDDTSPWPERRRAQGLLLGAGGALLAVVGLALADVVALSQTGTVVATTIASALLIYGLLGWAGTWVEDGVEGQGVREDDAGREDGDHVDADGDTVDRDDTDGNDGDRDDAGEDADEPDADEDTVDDRPTAG